MIKKIIICLSLLLIIIFFLFIFFSNLNYLKKNLNRKSTRKTTPTPKRPTLFINQKNKPYQIYTPQSTNNVLITTQPTSVDNKFYERKILPRLNLFNQKEEEKFTTFIKNLPLLDKNYSIFYSPLFNKVYFKPQNSQGKKQVEELIKKYQLEKIINKFPQNFIIDENITEEKIRLEENIFLENKQKNLLANYQKDSSLLTITPFLTTIPSPQSTEQNSLRILGELLKILSQSSELYQTNLENNYLSPSPSIFPPPSSSLPQLKINNLTELFNDVSQRVGVPVKILEGVLTIEMPSTFNLTPEQVALYSQPGNRINNCSPNVCSATGPMQMTIGIDNSGSNKCLSCGLNSCPNAWASYGNAVNIYTKDTHIPDPCNLRDNIFAAAYKLKTDSQAPDPLNWTQEQVYRAGTRYYGSCADKYRYERLGNRTYCEFLWWYYNNK